MNFNDLRKTNTILLFIITLGIILFYGKSVLIPLAFAGFLAFLLTPVSNWMESKGLSRGASSTISTLLIFLVTSGLLALMVDQLRVFAGDLPEMKANLRTLSYDLRSEFQIGPMVDAASSGREMNNGITKMIQQKISGFVEDSLLTMVMFLLTLIYLFLLLMNRHHYDRFILMYTKKEDEEKTREVMFGSSQVAHQYLWGRSQVMILLGIAYIITFLAFDLPYALLLTIFGTLVTIIPYVGPFVSGTAPILIMISSGRDMSTILLFTGIVMVIQLIESYVLEPLLLAKAVQISPLSVIIAVVLGGAIWGIAGMILFVPFFAIAKIFFDHNKDLRPIGFLLGLEEKGRVKMSDTSGK